MYRKSGNFHHKNIFVVDGSYENESYEKACTLLMLTGLFLRKLFNAKIYHMKVLLHENFQIYDKITNEFSVDTALYSK